MVRSEVLGHTCTRERAAAVDCTQLLSPALPPPSPGLGIPLATLDTQPKLDVAIDGADEVSWLTRQLVTLRRQGKSPA